MHICVRRLQSRNNHCGGRGGDRGSEGGEVNVSKNQRYPTQERKNERNKEQSLKKFTNSNDETEKIK